MTRFMLGLIALLTCALFGTEPLFEAPQEQFDRPEPRRHP